MSEKSKEFIHDKNQQQFRLLLDPEVAVVDYKMKDDVMHLTFAGVPEHLRGKGLGKILVENTFEYIEQHNVKAVAICPFIKLVAGRSEKWSKIIQ